MVFGQLAPQRDRVVNVRPSSFSAYQSRTASTAPMIVALYSALNSLSDGAAYIALTMAGGGMLGGPGV